MANMCTCTYWKQGGALGMYRLSAGSLTMWFVVWLMIHLFLQDRDWFRGKMEQILATWIEKQKHLLAEPPTPVSVFPEICTPSPDHCMRTETFKHLLTIALGKLS